MIGGIGRALRSLLGETRMGRLARYERTVARMERLAPGLSRATDEELRSQSAALRARARAGAPTSDLVVEAFALVREAARRTLGLRHYDVQLMGGLALHEGLVAEIKTGEGKTLVATLSAYVESLSGQGVHVVTVNDYLAARDAEWMGAVYAFLGTSVGVVTENVDAPDEVEHKRAAYACDVTYVTNQELVFDYLRDQLATSAEEMVQRGFFHAIVDEADFILIDEARTPLVISAASGEATHDYERVAAIVRRLQPERHYQVEHKTRTAFLTDAGYDAVSSALGGVSLCAAEHVALYHVVHQSVLAQAVYERDVDYVVEDDEVFLIDEFTGRLSEEKRFENGLHQALEAKEGVPVRSEDHTVAKITYQTFFSRYERLSGMTGTARSEREELRQTLGCDVATIPTHRPMIRRDEDDRIYVTLDDKHAAVVEEIAARHARGQPVLVGATSVRESEQLSERLRARGIEHALLNAKDNQAEAEIIAGAGKLGAVTISTNMAGRGTDIKLGGASHAEGLDPEASEGDGAGSGAEDEARRRVAALGGLRVIGTGRHESVRTDRQLRGRAGRQGDPGSSAFFTSLDDAVFKKFGRKSLEAARAELEQRGHPPGAPVDSSAVRRLLDSLQAKVEHENRATRRHVLSFDRVIAEQREHVYAWRRELVVESTLDAGRLFSDFCHALALESPDREAFEHALASHLHEPTPSADDGADDDEAATEQREREWLVEREERAAEGARRAVALLERREAAWPPGELCEIGRVLLLTVIDELWADHLTNLERLEDGVSLASYAEVEPLVEWRRQSALLWRRTLFHILSRSVDQLFALEPVGAEG